MVPPAGCVLETTVVDGARRGMIQVGDVGLSIRRTQMPHGKWKNFLAIPRYLDPHRSLSTGPYPANLDDSSSRFRQFPRDDDFLAWSHASFLAFKEQAEGG